MKLAQLVQGLKNSEFGSYKKLDQHLNCDSLKKDHKFPTNFTLPRTLLPFLIYANASVSFRMRALRHHCECAKNPIKRASQTAQNSHGCVCCDVGESHSLTHMYTHTYKSLAPLNTILHWRMLCDVFLTRKLAALLITHTHIHTHRDLSRVGSACSETSRAQKPAPRAAPKGPHFLCFFYIHYCFKYTRPNKRSSKVNVTAAVRFKNNAAAVVCIFYPIKSVCIYI